MLRRFLVNAKCAWYNHHNGFRRTAACGKVLGMKHIVAINASPRTTWNTASLVREAAEGAASEDAEVTVFDLYRLEKFTGCVSCFGCKLPEHQGMCVLRDGLTPVLEAIRKADGLIIDSPNYLGDVSAAFRALYERLIFQVLTYKVEPRSYGTRRIPVLFLMTSNCAEEYYHQTGYDSMLEKYQQTLSGMVGPTRVMISGDTLQVSDYSRYQWTMFDPDAKKARHDHVFPEEKKKAFAFGTQLVKDPWQ